eukprot:308330-Amphidinium_carterae.2
MSIVLMRGTSTARTLENVQHLNRNTWTDAGQSSCAATTCSLKRASSALELPRSTSRSCAESRSASCCAAVDSSSSMRCVASASFWASSCEEYHSTI